MAYIIQTKVTAGMLIDLFADPDGIDAIMAAKEGKKSREEYLDDVRIF